MRCSPEKRRPTVGERARGLAAASYYYRVVVNVRKGVMEGGRRGG